MEEVKILFKNKYTHDSSKSSTNPLQKAISSKTTEKEKTNIHNTISADLSLGLYLMLSHLKNVFDFLQPTKIYITDRSYHLHLVGNCSNASCILIHLILTVTLSGWYHCSPHFKDEDTEAQIN